MHINCLELSNWTRLTETPSTIGMRSVCSVQWLFLCILTVSLDPASIPWLNRPFLIPSHFSDKFDKSALRCWRNFIILFPGVITLNKRIMDWKQKLLQDGFPNLRGHWWPCYRNPFLNFFALKISKITCKYTLAGVISLGEL